MTTDATVDDQAARLEMANQGIRVIPLVERAGIEVLEVEPGRCRLRAPAEPNVNHFGTMYAGALYTLGEVPGGVLFFATFDASKYFPLVKASRIRYRRPARGDIFVEAQIPADEVERLSAEADATGRADWEMEFELTDADGEVVAIISHEYQMRTHGSLS